MPETRLSHSIKRGEFTIRKNVVGLNDYSNPPTDTRQGFFFATTILSEQLFPLEFFLWAPELEKGKIISDINLDVL